MYSLSAITRRKFRKKEDVSKLPPYVPFILFHLRERLARRHMIHCPRGRPKGGGCLGRFRSDAKAEGEQITIGGYATFHADGSPIPHSEARWFKLELTRQNATWAYAKGEPFRSIASLELLGTVISTMLLLGKEEPDEEYQHGGVLSAGAVTDNLGNKFAVSKLMSTKWPLTAFVAELACQLEVRHLHLHMTWVPREQNVEADAITNGDTHWLCQANEVVAEMDKLPFEMLPILLAKGRSSIEISN